MNYLGATKGYFIRKQLENPKYMEMAKALNIVALSEKTINHILESYKLNLNLRMGAFSKNIDGADEIFFLFRRFEPSTINYLLNGFWRDVPRRQISTLIAASRKVNDSAALEDDAKFFLLSYILSLFSIATLRFSKDIITIPPDKRDKAIELMMLGGSHEVEDIQNQYKSFHAFMSKEIKDRYQTKYPINQTEFIDLLIPPYTKHLIELIKRICESPVNAIMSPRFFDIFSFDFLLSGSEELDLQSISYEGRIIETDKVLKSVSDIILFAKMGEMLPKSLVSIFEDVIRQLIADKPISYNQLKTNSTDISH